MYSTSRQMNKYYPEIFFRTACIWRLFRKYRDKALFGITLRNCRFPLCLTLRQSTRGSLAGFRQYSDCGGVSCPPLFPSTIKAEKCQTLLLISSSLLRQTSPFRANSRFAFFITTTVAPCRFAKSVETF